MDESVSRGRLSEGRKRRGVVYTPAPIARFLVARTIALSLDERRAALLAQHGGCETPAFWRAWLDALRSFKIIDPACGDGALLDVAYDEMARRYEEIALGAMIALDVARETIANNLFGVDIDAHAVEAARHALWSRCPKIGTTSEPNGPRDNLRAGDSLIDDIAAPGGFDVVIGNPPYVRMEYLKAAKPYLAKHYAVAAERADLYAYFFEKGVRLLKDGGRLGFISSSSFFRTGAGESLRRFLTANAMIESVVDFGDLRVFDDVVTYPAIVTLRKSAERGDLSFVLLKERAPKDLETEFAEKARRMPQARLGASVWRFEEEALARLRAKIAKGRKTLREVYGSPLWGIKTGLNDAFVIDGATRDALVAADPRSAEILKPYMRGASIGRWRRASEDWLVDAPKGAFDIAEYPAVEAWLTPLRSRLERRATRQKWFELQQAQLAYRPGFAAPKIVFPDISQGPKFALDDSGDLIDATCFCLPCADFALLAFLNSRLCWFVLHAVSNPLRGGKWRLRLKAQYLEPLPLPDFDPQAADRLTALARANCDAAADPDDAERLAEIEIREREIDAIVYDLFGLSAAEAELLEASLAGQY
ncbi:N-6 DNA methylase [Methylosinus sporium]|uniref:site-specific DNA-methyltransferase (adenine-specific) n=1 Tax=Methylosinus sporium TaxID=428 RepID=A0A549T532_METSR|nr:MULTISPECIES: N-6 DNA methylase [Methylosinus]MBU3889746.1 Eco57I restriction-modification methylase domain-containing protein [Methylosinus sp. KRF6]TRL36930.1 N-6 DNA methylase [Methylosinus sporium]